MSIWRLRDSGGRSARKALRDALIIGAGSILYAFADGQIDFGLPREMAALGGPVAMYGYRMLRDHNSALERLDPR